MTNLPERIRNWNKDRGYLSGDFDPTLEIKMLSEELNEVVTATDYAHCLQEAADFAFVATGTQAKWAATKFESHGCFELAYAKYKDMNKWIDESTEFIALRLQALAPEDYSKLIERHLKEALRLVTEANEAKPKTKDANGKVIKGDNYKSPLEAIREYLRDEGVLE